MINDFNNGAEAWTDWNVLVDDTGGPNHVSNFCYAPLIGFPKTGELRYMSSFYYIGHFSKFVRPGAKRIISSSTTDNLLTTAFLQSGRHDRGRDHERLRPRVSAPAVAERKGRLHKEPGPLHHVGRHPVGLGCIATVISKNLNPTRRECQELVGPVEKEHLGRH